ncbi:MAG: lipoyl synthase [Gammaproteobacteria bacterium]
MTSNQSIKIVNLDGVRVIRNGVKPSANSQVDPDRKPPWLKIRLPDPDGKWQQVRQRVKEHQLNTVCQEALCPNLPECWSRGTATFMLLGSACTRACRFCAVDTGNPLGRINAQEPEQVARAVRLMGLKYVVLTSVNRDDLPDGGAEQFALSVEAVQSQNPDTQIEVLTPDFAGNLSAVSRVATTSIRVFAHNIETTRRLTPSVRDVRATYDQSLSVLAHAGHTSPEVIVKSGMMLGLGETDAEIDEALGDLLAHGVKVLTLGQYLRPTRNHLPVVRWVSPQDFARYKDRALERGFVWVSAGPHVRSSYKAEQAVGAVLLDSGATV